MKKVNVFIVGGGVSGLSCGLILGSGIKSQDTAKDKSVYIMDNDRSDAKRGEFYNALGIEQGIDGRELIERSKDQVLSYPAVEITKATVINIEKSDNSFKITDHKKNEYSSDIIVFASGFRGMHIKGMDLPVEQFPRTTNNTRVMLRNTDNLVDDNIYVCGLLSGHSSQWSIAAGSGAQVGVDILSRWAGEWKVVHDKNGM
jgi:thioredoxin reductase